MATATTVSDGRHAYRPQAIGRVFGWFFLATILTSVPAYFVGYHQMLNNPGLITGAGANPAPGIATGAALEVFLIIAYAALMTDAYPPFRLDQGGAGLPAPAPDDLAPASAARGPAPADGSARRAAYCEHQRSA